MWITSGPGFDSRRLHQFHHARLKARIYVGADVEVVVVMDLDVNGDRERDGDMRLLADTSRHRVGRGDPSSAVLVLLCEHGASRLPTDKLERRKPVRG